MATAHVIRNVLYFADTKSISTPKKWEWQKHREL
jgi:hypothetical protein